MGCRGSEGGGEVANGQTANGRQGEKPGEARLPNDLMIEPEGLVVSCRMVPIGLNTRRAVVKRGFTARRAFRISAPYGQDHRLLRFNGKIVREPRRTKFVTPYRCGLWICSRASRIS